MLAIVIAAVGPLAVSLGPSPHKVECGGRECRPGEGNPTVTHGDNPYETPLSPDMLKGVPHEPDPKSHQYAALVHAAHAAATHRLVVMCAADFDYRLIARNWHAALTRLGLTNGIVYSLDSELHAHLLANGVPSADGSANVQAWNRTRLVRHIQRAEAERHLAAAALAASGLNVFLTEATHVMLRDATPLLHAVAKAGEVDTAFARSGCNGKPPTGCGFWWNMALLIGGGTTEQRERAIAFQLAGIRVGMVDFYLRWWNGAHCIFSGYGKHVSRCEAALEHGVSPADVAANTSATAVVTLSGGCDRVRLGMLPMSFYRQTPFYGPSGGARADDGAVMARASKPAQRDRLRLDRYDEQDFSELVGAMKADGLWFLEGG